MEKERFSPRYFISNFDNAMTKENIDLPSEYDTVDLATLVIWSSSDNERKRLTFTTLSKFEVQKYLESFYSFWALTESRISTSSSSSLSKLRPNLKERDDNSRRVVYSVTQKTLYFATKEKVNLSSNIWLYFSQIFASQK